MQAYRIETKLTKQGTITLRHLPFEAGETVEIIILTRTPETKSPERYPLRGTTIQYLEPTEPVALDEWEILQ